MIVCGCLVSIPSLLLSFLCVLSLMYYFSHTTGSHVKPKLTPGPTPVCEKHFPLISFRSACRKLPLYNLLYFVIKTYWKGTPFKTAIAECWGFCNTFSIVYNITLALIRKSLKRILELKTDHSQILTYFRGSGKETNDVETEG